MTASLASRVCLEHVAIKGFGFGLLHASILLTVFYHKVAVADLPETSLTTFKYYDTKLQWNDAYNFCKSKGEELIKEDTLVRESALTKVVTYLNGLGYFSTNIWIGLHDIYSDQSGQLYKWSDCTNQTDWNNFDVNQVFSEDSFCVSLNPADMSWIITNCSKNLHVFCEKATPCSCSLNHKTDESPDLTVTQSVIKTVSSLSECKVLCLEHVRGSEECWGMTFNYTDHTCYIHERMQLQTYSFLSNLEFYAKICFEASFSLSVIAPTTPASDIPNAGCTENDVIPTPVPCIYDFNTTQTTTPGTTSGISTITIESSTTEKLTTNVIETTTMMSGTSTIPQSSTGVVPMCNCTCQSPRNALDIPLEKHLELLVSILSIDKKNTSIARRRFYSPGDHRISAQGIGYAGVFVLSFIVFGIVLLDFSRLKQDVVRGLYNIRIFSK